MPDRRPAGPRSHGFSLIEMMIALTIGAFLVLGVSQIYIDNRRSYLFQQGQTGNRNNALLTLQLLDRQLARTGYRANVLSQTNLAAAFTAISQAASDGDGADCPAFERGVTLKATGDSAEAPSGICFRFQGALDSADLDCLGNAIPRVNLTTGANVLAKLRFVPGNAPGLGAISCSTWIERNGALTRKGSSTLVQGLTDFRWFLLPAAAASNPAVRYAALFSSREVVPDGIASIAADNWKTLTGRQVDGGNGGLHIVQSTVVLRNLAP